MKASHGTRIQAIDLLKGIVMVVMALDHVREFFHSSALVFPPLDPVRTSWPIYFTAWISHFCAPAFSFLAGISAFFIGTRKSTTELSFFLLTRGLWLVFIDIVFINFAWFADIHFATFALTVISTLGISMIVLAGLVHLPRKFILIFSVALIFGHHFLDRVHFEGSLLWAILHEIGLFPLPAGRQLLVAWALIPWIAVMSLGYCFGQFYSDGFGSGKRRKILNAIGCSALTLFVIIRFANGYGNPVPWEHFATTSQTLMSFLSTTKYPPSLTFLLLTLGVAILFLANSENAKGKIAAFFCTFGRVPFLFYVIHLYLIHLLAMIYAQAAGFGWQKLTTIDWLLNPKNRPGYGVTLWVVYVIWMLVTLSIYPLCKKFDAYKKTHKEKKWLSYL
jgi:uncharacterized membrane protein